MGQKNILELFLGFCFIIYAVLSIVYIYFNVFGGKFSDVECWI
jgi:hypothetical protein